MLKFAKRVILNTGRDIDQSPARTTDAGWEMLINQKLFIDQFLPHGVIRPLSQEEMDHYHKAFIKLSSRKPLWRWPTESPIAGEPAEVAEAVTHYNHWLQQAGLRKLLLYAAPGDDLIPASQVEGCTHPAQSRISPYR